ncbi:MAG: aspartate aminotransferase family protein [Acidimicrobiales bacterium]|nr:aspartate aminotransferase family protein [Acidimicrobiales bacterium]RZV46031.1 MAG: aspartate aminotransferase family protein [Acidimicrobiales bacterium]
MDLDEFRQAGHDLIDWIADYWERLEDLPVLSQVAPGDIRASLPASPPEAGEPWADIMADVDSLILPGVTHWQSPNFFAYFPANASPPSVLGELLSAGLGVQGMLWATSPACTELETHMLDWMIELCGLPDRFLSTGPGGGTIQDSASSGALVAILSARERVAGQWRMPELVAYTSEHAHSSLEKGVRIAGLFAEQIRVIPSDENHAMDPVKLREAMVADIVEDRRPFFVQATTGTTSTTALDPIEAIADVCKDFGAWLHVDGAFAGSAAVAPEYRFVNAGLQRADSYSFNPHKWLLTNFDCSLFYIADRGPMISALSVLPEYLRNEATEKGAVIDYRDWQISLGRRFRALKLWFVIRTHGAEGLANFVRSHVDMAQDFAERIGNHPSYEIVAPNPLSLVTFRHIGGDAENERIRDTINASGDAYLTHTKINDQVVLRVSIGSQHTEQRHVDAMYGLLDTLA